MKPGIHYPNFTLPGGLSAIAPNLAAIAHELEVLDRHRDNENRDPAEIERTIVDGGDPVVDVDVFLPSMAEYSRLGIGTVWLSPPGPDPAGCATQVTEKIVTRLADLS